MEPPKFVTRHALALAAGVARDVVDRLTAQGVLAPAGMIDQGLGWKPIYTLADVPVVQRNLRPRTKPKS
jgi:hypothetical protein